MSNFEFLKNTKEYALFAPAVMEAKRTSKESGYAVCGLFRAEVWPQTDDVYDEWI